MIFLLTGCATLKLVSLGISGISYLTTGKSLSDHAISVMTEQDCALHRVVLDEMVCRKTNKRPNHTADTQVAKITLPAEPTVLSTDNLNNNPSLSSQITAHNTQEHHTTNHYQASKNTLEYYKVIGSFNNKSYANTRANLYKNLNAKVILNSDNHAIKYRVIFGPVEKSTEISRVNKITDTEKQPDWLIGLCSNNLMPPPCNNVSKSAILANIKY
jgi:hypothetical protein